MLSSQRNASKENVNGVNVQVVVRCRCVTSPRASSGSVYCQAVEPEGTWTLRARCGDLYPVGCLCGGQSAVV